MTTATDLTNLSQPLPLGGIVSAAASADEGIARLHALLRELETVAAASHASPPVFSSTVDDQLVQARLGMASSLFAALQCKNAAVAGHALRVALTCSSWATHLGLPESERDIIEIAALLHDVGLIGVPDHILLKAGTLDAGEAAVIANARKMSLNILQRSCRSTKVLDIVESIPVWYDGSCKEIPLGGREIPLGARMIAIAEAFDAMTTDHVYRPARSQERAMAELFECAGSQFDPELVERFAEFRQAVPTAAPWDVAHRWLRLLETHTADLAWESNAAATTASQASANSLFQERLLDNMYDAVVFVDAGNRVILWNRGAERLTGVAGAGICGQPWRPELLGLADEKGRNIGEADCPLHTAIRCGAQSLRRLTITDRGGRSVAIDTHAIPVIDAQGVSRGAILLFHDASPETSLEQRCQNLHEKATKDPLTQAANRAEFDRVHALFVATHQQQRVPCSLLMCDLDRFKQVNDTFGHQAGDDAIKCLASLLKSSCRPGDLVARYGGEEFVMLCADCDNAAAARRAEQIRQSLSQVPQPRMDGKTVTVSFGVTEIQPGDTPETMLRRADRALLMAKANGRNNVVQLGSGSDETPVARPTLGFLTRSKEFIAQDLVTPVPVKMAIEKLRGFVADHQAKIVSIDGSHVRLEIEEKSAGRLRRFTDRPVAFWIDLTLEEERRQKERPGTLANLTNATRTKLRVTISPRRNRDRRRNDAIARAREVLMSFRSYLMASEDESATPAGALVQAKRALMPWLTR